MEYRCQKTKRSHGRFWIIFIILMLIILTRAWGLTYNMSIHPDEPVFYRSTISLLEAIMKPEAEYVEVKEYPEGAYIFHLLFHAIGKGVGLITGVEQEAQIWGRISSVFYFSLAVVIGMLILWEVLGKSTTSAILYGITMCFSLFFIEHSRYGVGDMISLFLLMCIVWFTAKAFSSGYRARYLLLACAASGAMGAVKYPQLLFTLIPILTYTHYAKTLGKKRIFLHILTLLLAVFLTFLMFSPKAALDWSYFLRVIKVEGDAYVSSGTKFEAGGFWNHIAGTVIYSLLYSDFPLSFAFLMLGVIFPFRRDNAMIWSTYENDDATIIHLMYVVVPVICIIFFVYNLFATLLVFRTYTPFFGLSALYVSYLVSKILSKGGWRRNGIILLAVFMIIRGGGLMYVSSSQEKISNEIVEKISGAVDENWKNSIKITPYNIPFSHYELKNPRIFGIDELILQENMEIEPGTLVISGAFRYALAEDYIFPINSKDAERISKWKDFVLANKDYFVGQAYPDYYYYVFGGWIRGVTLSTSLIPCNCFYYRP